MIYFLTAVIFFFIAQVNCDSSLNISLGEKIVIYTDSESTNWSFISKINEKVVDKCQVNHSGPRGRKNYTIPLEKNKNTELYRSDNISCSFKIPQVRHEHFGEWIVITSFSDDKNVSEQVTIYEKKVVKPLPLEILFVNRGDNVTIKINQSDIFGEMKSTEIVNFYLEKIGSSIEIDINNSGNEDFKKSGQLGIEIHMTPEKIGTWLLTARHNYTKISAYFKLIMLTTLYWERNSGQTLKLDVDDKKRIDTCEIIKPKTQVALNLKNCDYQIDNVTIDHAGTWIGRYVPKNLVALPAEERFIVQVFENQKKIKTKLGATLKIECKSPVKFSSCLIQPPNGSPLPGTITGPDENICSITAANATSVHSGQWSCQFLLPNGQQIQSIVLVTVKEPHQTSNFPYIFALIILFLVIVLSILMYRSWKN